MWSQLKKSLSGESTESKKAMSPEKDHPQQDLKKGKRCRSGEMGDTNLSATNQRHKRKKTTSKGKLTRQKELNTSEISKELEEGELSESFEEDSDGYSTTSSIINEETVQQERISTFSLDKSPITEISLPADTPEWGKKLFEMFQNEFRRVTTSVEHVSSIADNNASSVKDMEQKLAKVELHNRSLTTENTQLKEKLLDLEYQQKRNNLIFEGISDMMDESDVDCINKIHYVVAAIPGLDKSFKIDRCYRIDGVFKPSAKKPRRILCTFNWHVDVQFILRHRKLLPRGVFVNEDLPEEWNDRRQILKPLYNAAKRKENVSAHLTKDKLVINGKTGCGSQL